MSYSVLQFALLIGLAAISLAMLLTGWRLVQGPTLMDRILALDTLYINVVTLIILLGLYLNNTLLFEAALLVAMLGFVSTVALARYVTRGDTVE
ncbi:MAG: K+/H+ antiporter subunit F [Pseudomonadota bacterium]|nr:K+/H+ antiporter subunit F [Pseudomonadota bacterium]